MKGLQHTVREYLRENRDPGLSRIARPAFAAERQYGLKDLGQRYKMPPGLSGQQIQHYIYLLYDARKAEKMSGEEAFDRQSAVWEKLKELNPALRTHSLKECPSLAEKNQQLFSLISGVVSGYKSRDIKFFLSVEKNTLDAYADPEYEKLRHKVGNHVKLQFLASKACLRDVYRQISEKKLPPRKRDPNLVQGMPLDMTVTAKDGTKFPLTFSKELDDFVVIRTPQPASPAPGKK